MDFTSISDEALLSGLSAMMTSERQLGARVVAYLLEVQDRRLDLKAACSSLFDFCTRRLGMSEGEAFRRINAARLVRQFPRLLGCLEKGETHLSALVLLRDHLTSDNYDELVRSASGKSKRQIEELLASRFPKPDMPTSFRPLPSTAVTTPTTPTTRNEDRAACSLSQGKIEPLSSVRYKLQLTTSRELRDKMERATRLMRHRNPSGDLGIVLEQAVELLIAKLEKERLGKSERPQEGRKAKHGYVTRAARREVFERDGEQCSFIGGNGERCTARAFLEVDHVRARALGGSGDAANLCLLCKAHDLLRAEEVFGRYHVEDKIAIRRGRRSAAANVHSSENSENAVEREVISNAADSTEAPYADPSRRSPPAAAAIGGSESATERRQSFSSEIEQPPSGSLHRQEAIGPDITVAQSATSHSSRQQELGGADTTISGSVSTGSSRRQGSGVANAASFFRQQKSTAKNASCDEWTQLLDRAAQGLTNIGFRSNDARRALDIVHNRWIETRTEPPPIEQLLREALAVLC